MQISIFMRSFDTEIAPVRMDLWILFWYYVCLSKSLLLGLDWVFAISLKKIFQVWFSSKMRSELLLWSASRNWEAIVRWSQAKEKGRKGVRDVHFSSSLEQDYHNGTIFANHCSFPCGSISDFPGEQMDDGLRTFTSRGLRASSIFHLMWLLIHESCKSSHGQLLPWLDSGQRCEKWATTNVFDNYLARMALPVCFRPSYSSLFTINGQENVLPENVIRVYFWMNTSKEGREQRDSLFIAKKNIFQINLHCPLSGFSMCFHSICFHGRAEIEEHDRPFHMQHTCTSYS